MSIATIIDKNTRCLDDFASVYDGLCLCNADAENYSVINHTISMRSTRYLTHVSHV